MIDCDHNAPFVNVAGIAMGDGGACSKCGKVIVANYAQLLRFAAVAKDYADDCNNTISSLQTDYPHTASARMDRRMELRQRFINSAVSIREEN